MEWSILEFIGNDLLTIITPVSICMLLVVLLISTLYSPSTTNTTPIITAANLIYTETPSDTPLHKLQGALLNAAVFILLIAAVTFLLLLLYYYNFTSFLKNYMRLSSFLILATIGGAIFLSLIRHFSFPIDAFTCLILLFNFSVVGVFSVFGGGVPIVVTQCYTVCLGIITAAWFAQLPEWTTWVLLVALAVYDLVAVLAPGGPLKLLVELSQSRDDDLPALVYEARPTVGRSRTGGLGLLVGGVSDNGCVELQGSSSRDHIDDVEDNRASVDEEIEERSPLVESLEGEREREREREGRGDEEGGDPEMTMSRGIKLGLGDFVFYSVLVGRAAMYDLMTVYACYLAIISGLACTLILLSVCGRALPALPISITLGVMFYFLTRLLMEPFVVHTSTNLLMF